MKIYHRLDELKQIKNHKTVLHFTGSMFGVGCSYDDIAARDKIDLLKERGKGKGYIILIPDVLWLEDFGIKISKKVLRILQQFWPGNLTAILRDSNNIFSEISLNGNIAVRIPHDALLRNYIRLVGKPFISTSINLSGQKPQTNLKEIISDYRDWFDYGILPDNVPIVANEPSTIVDLSEGNLKLIRNGSLDYSLLKESWEYPTIMFVCTGNTCRSPLAEFYAEDKFRNKDLHFHAISSGFVSSGMPMAKHSSQLLDELNIEHRWHLSKIVTKEMIARSWLILTMEEKHKSGILNLNPDVKDRLFTLSEICGGKFCLPNKNIDDPYGLDIYFYRTAFNLIKQRINCLIDKIEREEL